MKIGIRVTEGAITVHSDVKGFDVVLFDERTYTNVKGSENRERMRSDLNAILDMDQLFARPRIQERKDPQ